AARARPRGTRERSRRPPRRPRRRATRGSRSGRRTSRPPPEPPGRRWRGPAPRSSRLLALPGLEVIRTRAGRLRQLLVGVERLDVRDDLPDLLLGNAAAPRRHAV